MTVTATYQLSDLLTELNRVFDLLNKEFFAGKLYMPIIIVQSARKKRVLGTCSVNRIWVQKHDDNKNPKHEISISAEYLDRPIEEICATLLHEMVHLYNGLHDIKDTSNNCVYHNKRFKEESEKRGLIIEKAPTIGWSVTTLKPETKTLIKSFNINEAVFDYYRQGAKVFPTALGKGTLTKEEKLQKLYARLEKIKQRIQKVEAEE
jgi:hypothetical protein